MTSVYLNEEKTKIQFHHKMDIEGEYIPSAGNFVVHEKRTFKVYSTVHNFDTGIISINALLTGDVEPCNGEGKEDKA
ncbi:MAG: hypothetical protein LBF85_08885 [Tannerella sp.]|jgi:hypothetical protein|nr:hypothetical protein [Tannerella sp.]